MLGGKMTNKISEAKTKAIECLLEYKDYPTEEEIDEPIHKALDAGLTHQLQQLEKDIDIIIDFRIKHMNPNYAKEVKRMFKQELRVIKRLLLDENSRPQELREQLKKENGG